MSSKSNIFKITVTSLWVNELIFWIKVPYVEDSVLQNFVTQVIVSENTFISHALL